MYPFIDVVIEQILIDVERGDLTAIEELLRNVPEEHLIAFLSDVPEDKQGA